jgi:hypothetical protein
MGRRSRKRGLETTRAERDAARREHTRAPRPRPRPGRPGRGERPPAPWGSFPLSELVILFGLVLIVWGALSGEDGQERLFAGLVIASLGGGELALREHLAGYRSHTTLLAGVATFVVVTVVALGLGPVKIWLLLLIGLVVFATAFLSLRAVFKSRSGGVGFR